jgi:hypothetical protein
MSSGTGRHDAVRNPDISGAYIVTGDFKTGRLQHRLS